VSRPARFVSLAIPGPPRGGPFSFPEVVRVVLLFDRFVVALYLPEGADPAAEAALRAALDAPEFAGAVERAVRAALGASPELAPLVVAVEW